MSMRALLVGLLLLGSLILNGCAVSRTVEMPESARTIVTHPRASWGAQPPVSPMKSHRIERITIHHTATYQRPDRSIEDKLRGLQAFSQRVDSLGDGRLKPAWADVPYHFYIDVHGQIAEGREVGYPGDTNTAYDPAGHVLIVLEGNFEEEDLNDEQRTSLLALTRVLAQHWHISADRIAAHRDFADTLCPGQALYDWLSHLRAALNQR
ncbi:MAG: hypothetical protein RhofKO_26070 [Rhodothermales bacterium]